MFNAKQVPPLVVSNVSNCISVGSVFVSLDTGEIQMYSHHQHGGIISSFKAVHKAGDCVLAMTTDRKNRFLYTGTAFGYVKVWHIINYG